MFRNHWISMSFILKGDGNFSNPFPYDGVVSGFSFCDFIFNVTLRLFVL